MQVNDPHTHTHTYIERDREIEREGDLCIRLMSHALELQ